MSDYAAVDAVIAQWAKSLGAKLHTEWAGEPARFFYLPGDPPFECFQISVTAPREGSIKVFAFAVDTNDDTDDDLQEVWSGPVADLDAMLASAADAIARWKTRTRRSADPPSPW